MDDKMKESISALMDDEANELEVQRLLSKSDSEQLLDTWKRYHTARDLMSGMSGRIVEVDVAARVASAIRGDELDQVDLSQAGASTSAASPPTLSSETNQQMSDGHTNSGSNRFWTYGGAVAACLVVAFGFTQLGEHGVRGGGEFAVVNEASNSNQLVVNELDESQVRSFNQYLLRHSELSTVTVASGVAPLVRVASVNSVGI